MYEILKLMLFELQSHGQMVGLKPPYPASLLKYQINANARVITLPSFCWNTNLNFVYALPCNDFHILKLLRLSLNDIIMIFLLSSTPVHRSDSLLGLLEPEAI